jgi:phospholipase/lecithinase/hemolysin
MKVSRLSIFDLGVVLGLLLFTNVAAASPTYLISYGDSLSDNGNLFAFTQQNLGFGVPAPPYWQGRVSNGPVTVEYLAHNTGLSLLDFAWGGATTGIGNSLDGGTQTSFGAFGLPGMLTELAQSQGTIAPIAHQSVAVVWGGPDDFLANGFSQHTADVAVSDILSIVNTLEGLHTSEIIVPGMPDLSLTPDYYGNAGVQALSIYFNTQLQADLPGNVRFIDTFSLLHAIVANPAAYGFTDVSDPCYVGDYYGNYTSLCSNPGQYLFWDGLHPTTRADEILAQSIQGQALPEPSTLLMLGSGVIGLGALVRRRMF